MRDIINKIGVGWTTYTRIGVDMKDCKHYCEGYYSDDIGYDEKDKIDACGLTQTGYHEMSYKKCSDITNCYYKQLLAEQAKNAELNGELVNKNQQLFKEQAKNKKLVEIITYCIEMLNRTSKEHWHRTNIIERLQQALNEVNK